VIIALTGWGQASDRRKSTDAGFDSHWVKPVDPAVLLELLSRPSTTAPPTPPPSVPAP
jgi:CheY-like chemotaxis protein